MIIFMFKHASGALDHYVYKTICYKLRTIHSLFYQVLIVSNSKLSWFSLVTEIMYDKVNNICVYSYGGITAVASSSYYWPYDKTWEHCARTHACKQAPSIRTSWYKRQECWLTDRILDLVAGRGLREVPFHLDLHAVRVRLEGRRTSVYEHYSYRTAVLVSLDQICKHKTK